MEKVFAIDIGTRVVIGIIMCKTENGYEILASSRAEHSQRVMYDGQVHDVKEVTKAVLKVKDELEQKTGERLKKVAVAAAGRALITEIAHASREEPYPIQWGRENILALEMEALQNAIKKISTSESSQNNFYCVGYNVIKQYLEGQDISSLFGQRGHKAEVTLIATFLPRTVVDGLFSVLEHSNLEMDRLTLEPIAAGQVAIPKDMRRLNLALVDIGAGTSDIAITHEGSITSFGMVPMAGDEITEALCEYFLVDFTEGEKIKKNLKNKDEIEITNFFGNKEFYSQEQIIRVIESTVRNLAEKIYQEILLLNQNAPPQAIILVGGGSQTPLLKELLADISKLSVNRIGVQTRERLNNILGDEKNLNGADVITPIGIGLAALEGNGLHYYSVTVNSMCVPIFEFNHATVAEALFAAGIHPWSFIGRPGKALVYFLNGKMEVLKGELGKSAEILVNSQPAALEQRVYPNDRIDFMPGRNGNDAKAQVKDVISINPPKRIFWNGDEEDFKPLIYIDHKVANHEDWLSDGCKLNVIENNTLFDLLLSKGIDIAKIKKKTIRIQGELKEIYSDIEIKVNGKVVKDNCIIADFDRINFAERTYLIKDLQIEPKPLIFYVNGKELLYKPQKYKIYNKGKEVSIEDPVENGMDLEIKEPVGKLILSELFPYLNLQEEAIPSGRLIMKVNNKDAEFTTEITQGDQIIVKWVTK
ncbi:MAG: ATPase [Peptococcaceae bacterium]|nr:ATPase [Peptococcaceae bacterium]